MKDNESEEQVRNSRRQELFRHVVAGMEFTRKEAIVVMDANNGSLMAWDADGLNAAMTGVWLNVADAIRLDQIDREHGLSDEEGAALVAKLQKASDLERLALVEMIEQFWVNCDRDTDELFAQLGFCGGNAEPLPLFVPVIV